MSIIYDALKKSQNARSAKTPTVAYLKHRLKRKQTIMTLLIMTCLFVIIAALTVPDRQSTSGDMLSQNTSKQAAIPVAKTSAPRLLLEGVFLSENERLAMINHHSYHEGDRVNGMRVVSIAFDQVTLQNKSRMITLRSNLAQLD